MTSTDIISADIASEGTYITAAVKVRDLYARSTETDATGFSFEFNVNRSRFSLYGGESHTRGTEFTVWNQTRGDIDHPTWGFIGYASGLFNDDESTVYITAPLKKLSLPAKGMSVTKIHVKSGIGYDALVTGTGTRTDIAISEASYPLGSRSCSPVPVEPCKDPRAAGIPRRDTCPGGP